MFTVETVGSKAVCCVVLIAPLAVFPSLGSYWLSSSNQSGPSAHVSVFLFFFPALLFISFLSSVTLLTGDHSNIFPMNMLFTYVLANVYFDWIDAYGLTYANGIVLVLYF